MRTGKQYKPALWKRTRRDQHQLSIHKLNIKLTTHDYKENELPSEGII